MMILYLISFIVNLTYVFLKGWQHKNVIGGHTKSAAGLAFFMGIMEVVSVSIIVKGGWGVAISTGMGAAIGIVLAMKLHDKVYRKQPQC